MMEIESVTSEEMQSIQILKNAGQQHILSEIPKHTPEDRKAFANQILHMNRNYPGGIENYVSKARKLLKDSSEGVNPYADYIPTVPKGQSVDFSSNEITDLEKIGLEELGNTAFVLVAGGLGERLGYRGIKIGIPIDLVTRTTYIQYYIEYILAFQKASKSSHKLPLAIMTSDDTHALTQRILMENNYFGMPEEQVYLMKQEKVPALLDNDANIALIPGRLEIDSKPHGHGDVHTLLYMHHLVDKWLNQGLKYVVFFQDTNAPVFRCLPSVLGVSKKNGFEVNSITIPRKPGEALGAICQLDKKDGTTSLTLNVEYNQLESLFKDNGGEPVDPVTKNSLFPGNTNTLVFTLKEYQLILNHSQGLIAEFINPKYADATKTKFKTPTRLECMMQDYPKLLGPSAKVGFTQFERMFCFSACKNDLKSAVQKIDSGLAPECASSCENAFYSLNAELLRIAGAEIEQPPKESSKIYAGISLNFGPFIVLKPSFGVTLEQIKNRIKGKVKVSAKSALVLEGDIVLKDIEVDGSYWLGGTSTIQGQKWGATTPEGFVSLVSINTDDSSLKDYLRIRGYNIKNSNAILKIGHPYTA